MKYLPISNDNKIEMLYVGDEPISIHDNEAPEYEISFRETKQGYWLIDIAESGLFLVPSIGDYEINVCDNRKLIITGVDNI